MATEENKEAEAEAEEKKSDVKNIVHIVEDENSYINSAKERMNDVIDTFLTNAETGFPGSPIIDVFLFVPNIRGLPGCIGLFCR